MANAPASEWLDRVTSGSRATYEGRLRWGDDQEAFWGDYFNAFKDDKNDDPRRFDKASNHLRSQDFDDALRLGDSCGLERHADRETEVVLPLTAECRRLDHTVTAENVDGVVTKKNRRIVDLNDA